MKRLLLSGAAVVAMAASQGHAADLMVPDVLPPVEPVIAPPAFSWTSFYIGAQVGGAWLGDDGDLSCAFEGKDDDYDGCDMGFPDVTELSVAAPALALFDDDDDDDDDIALIAGGHIGADVQFGNFVAGLVIDGNAVIDDDDDNGHSVSGSFDNDAFEGGDPFVLGTEDGPIFVILDPGDNSDQEYPADPRVDFAFAHDRQLEWYGTARARLGIAPGGGRVLLYGTGGFAFGEVEESSAYDVTAYYTEEEAFVNGDIFNPLDAPPREGLNGCEVTIDGGTDSGEGVDSYTCRASGSESDRESVWGFAVGGGVDVLVTRNFSLGLEYLYVNLDQGEDDDDGPDVADIPFDNTLFDNVDIKDEHDNLDLHTIMLRGSLRFGGGMLGG